MMIPKRKLGNQGLEVSVIGLGRMGMSFAYGTPAETESISTIHRGEVHISETVEISYRASIIGFLIG
jgi:hypothetical protein